MSIERRTVLKRGRRSRGGSRHRGTVPGLRRRTGRRARRPGLPRPARPPRRARRRRTPPRARGVQVPLLPRHRATVVLDDGTVLPGRHDGMAAFPGEGGRVTLVRNHEVNGTRHGVRPDRRPHLRPDGAGRVHRHRHHPHRGGPGGLDRHQRHPDELLRRPDAVGHVGDVRGDRQRARRRRRLHGRLERPAHPAARLHLRGADDRPLGCRARHQRRPVRPRVGRVRPPRRQPLPQRGQLRLPLRLLPLHAEDLPDGDRPPGQRRPPPDAQGQGRRRGAPRGLAGQGRPLPRRVGRHRRPGAVLPLHPGSTGSDDEQRRAGPRRQPGTGAGRSALLEARGDGLRQRRRLLHLDPGRRRCDDRAQHGHRLRQRLRAGLGLRHALRDALPRLRVAQPRRARLPGQHHVSRRGTLVLCEDNVEDNYVRGLSRGGQLWDIALNRLRPGRTNATSSRARRSAPTGTPSSSTSRPAAACPSRSGARGSGSASDGAGHQPVEQGRTRRRPPEGDGVFSTLDPGVGSSRGRAACSGCSPPAPRPRRAAQSPAASTSSWG